MCYNAANHWDLGWFENARRDLGSAGPSTPIQISLTAFTSYPSGKIVLVKVGNMYMQYNQAAVHNLGTDPNTANQLVVVEKHSNAFTSRLAVLDQGEEYKSGSFVVRVCSKQSASMVISIGRSSTNCGAAGSGSPPPPAPVPVIAPRVINNWWNVGAAPPTQFQRPNPPLPSPSTASYFRFNPTPPTTSWFQAPPSQPTGWSWKVSFTGGSAPTTKPWNTCFLGC
jgi:hypothetical protein